MRFVVKAACGSSRARTGLLYPGGRVNAIETPALLLSTRKGLPTYISPDLLSTLPTPHSRILHVSPMHFLDCPSLSTVSSIGGLHQMVGLEDCFFVASARDSIECLPASGSSNRIGASFETPSGRHLVKPTDYMKMISSLKPNMWVSLADEVPAWVSEKRNCASVDRTVRWLDECISLNDVDGASLLGAIVGGSSLEERKRCAEEVSLRNVSGYWIGGFGLGESMEERPALLDAIIGKLPEGKLRQISGLGLPEEVLEGIAAGIDLFDSTYIYYLTVGGFALVFPIHGVDQDALDPHLFDTGSDGTKMNLRATIYRNDNTPIISNCACYTCQNHTRAYINHLLNVHEMLAQILLEIHNTHHYLGFFRSVREAIDCGKFCSFHRKFIGSRRDIFSPTMQLSATYC